MFRSGFEPEAATLLVEQLQTNPLGYDVTDTLFYFPTQVVPWLTFMCLL